MREKRAAKPKYRFPWRNGHRFQLLVDGAAFYPAMLAAIGAARHYVLMEMYLFESGLVAADFIDALLNAARRGVQVSLLIDDYGGKRLSRRDRQRLRDGGVDLAFYNPLRFGLRFTRLRHNLFRDHRKLLAVDGTAAFTGGAGVTDEFDPELYPHAYWHEIMMEIRGPNVRDWEILFGENWNHWAAEPLHRPDLGPPEAAGGQAGRVVSSRNPVRSEIVRSFIKRIRYAERRVWLATAYFAPSRKLRRALRHSARRGMDVRLLLPGPHTDHPWVRTIGRRYYTRLLRNGVRIYEYQPRFLHVKMTLCDHWLSIGSSNVDRWNLRWNLEANQEIDDVKLAEQAAMVFEQDFAHCREIDYEAWQRRPWKRRLQEWFWGYVARALSRFSDLTNKPGSRGP